MSAFVVLPERPYVYNWKTNQYEYMTQSDYLKMREQQHNAESAGHTQNTQDADTDTEKPTLDRSPISKGQNADTTARDKYLQEILTTDKRS